MQSSQRHRNRPHERGTANHSLLASKTKALPIHPISDASPPVSSGFRKSPLPTTFVRKPVITDTLPLDPSPFYPIWMSEFRTLPKRSLGVVPDSPDLMSSDDSLDLDSPFQEPQVRPDHRNQSAQFARLAHKRIVRRRKAVSPIGLSSDEMESRELPHLRGTPRHSTRASLLQIPKGVQTIAMEDSEEEEESLGIPNRGDVGCQAVIEPAKPIPKPRHKRKKQRAKEIRFLWKESLTELTWKEEEKHLGCSEEEAGRPLDPPNAWKFGLEVGRFGDLEAWRIEKAEGREYENCKALVTKLPGHEQEVMVKKRKHRSRSSRGSLGNQQSFDTSVQIACEPLMAEDSEVLKGEMTVDKTGAMEEEEESLPPVDQAVHSGGLPRSDRNGYQSPDLLIHSESSGQFAEYVGLCERVE
jgi:hypothetical protein